MKLDSTHQWLGLAANVGVLIGLFILIYELNQNRTLLQAELGSASIVFQRDLEFAKFDQALSQSLSVALLTPEKLSLNK